MIGQLNTFLAYVEVVCVLDQRDEIHRSIWPSVRYSLLSHVLSMGEQTSM